jgi:hypothetical protein
MYHTIVSRQNQVLLTGCKAQHLAQYRPVAPQRRQYRPGVGATVFVGQHRATSVPVEEPPVCVAEAELTLLTGCVAEAELTLLTQGTQPSQQHRLVHPSLVTTIHDVPSNNCHCTC